jgi:hypothetical protein
LIPQYIQPNTHSSGCRKKDMGSEVDLITLSLAFYDPLYVVGSKSY